MSSAFDEESRPSASTREQSVDAERNSALLIGLLHFFVVFAAPALLWNSPVVDTTKLIWWTAAEAGLGVVSLYAAWRIHRHDTRSFLVFSQIESFGTAVTFSALAWLGPNIASEAPSKHVLMIALIAVTSISASNSAHITRRRPFFNKLIVMVAASYIIAFLSAGEFIFAALTAFWCIAIASLTRVAHHGMVELVELREASEKSARHDDLTELLSRTAFFDMLDATAAHAHEYDEPAVLVLFDLDGFKAINDSFGHAAGDGVLQTVAKRLGLFLPSDTALGRLGGDEFAAVFRSSEADLVTIIEAAIRAVCEPMRVQDRELYVAASAGWTLVTGGADSADLMAQADAALYQSKNSETDVSSGFNNELREELDRSLLLRQRFRSSLKRGEICFWAQPLVMTKDRSPLAVELLARWPQTDGSFVGPNEFTRVADETGLAVELDRQALAAAAVLLKRWQGTENGDLVVKANISPVHLHNSQLETSIEELIPADLRERLSLEFVESRLIATVERNHAQLLRLREMGIAISIDDFGVGYSSLTYLRSLPVDEVKIDRSFVTDVDSDPVNQGLVRAIVDVAATLGLPTVAEGIETAEEFAAVAELGVSAAQGYFLGLPRPLDDLDELLRSLRPMSSRNS